MMNKTPLKICFCSTEELEITDSIRFCLAVVLVREAEQYWQAALSLKSSDLNHQVNAIFAW